MPGTVVLSINACWNVLNFRRGLIAALREAGWHVVVLAPPDEHAARLAGIGVEHVPIAIDSAGLSPAGDLALLARYRRRLDGSGPTSSSASPPSPTSTDRSPPGRSAFR